MNSPSASIRLCRLKTSASQLQSFVLSRRQFSGQLSIHNSLTSRPSTVSDDAVVPLAPEPASSNPTRRLSRPPRLAALKTFPADPNAVVPETTEGAASSSSSPPPPQPILSQPSSKARQAATSTRPSKQKPLEIVGTVSRVGTMKKTVAVRTHRQVFDKYLKKHWIQRVDTLVHDPEEILVEGDVVVFGHFSSEERAERIKRGKKTVKFVLKRVITPFGLPLDQRSVTSKDTLNANGG